MPDDAERLTALEKKVDAIYESVEKTRKYLFWSFIIMIALVVLPALGLVFVVPSFLSSYNETLMGLEGL